MGRSIHGHQSTANAADGLLSRHLSICNVAMFPTNAFADKEDWLGVILILRKMVLDIGATFLSTVSFINFLENISSQTLIKIHWTDLLTMVMESH